MSFNEWKEVNLGNITKIKGRIGWKGYKTSDLRDYGPVVLGGNNVKNSINLDLNDVKHLSIEKYEESQEIMLKQNDILVVTRGNGIGDVSFFNGCLKEATINPSMVILSDCTENSRFLFYYLISSIGRNCILSVSSGSSIPAIYQKSLATVKCSIPTLLEQKSIADTLSCLDDKIELNNRINKILEEMAQAIFKSWFVDFEPFQDGEFDESELGMIPKGWRIVALGEVAKFVKGKKPTELLGVNTLENEEQYLTIDVLKGGNPQFACVDKMVLSNIYDILMVMDGASSGTIYFGLKGIVASTIAKLEVDHEQMREIVYQYLKVNEAEVKSHNTGSAIPHTDKGYVLRCKIAVPDDEMLKQISMSLKKIRETIITNSNENQTLNVIRDTLLPKLMSGEIRVPIQAV